MTKKAPPVPTDNQSHKGPGDPEGQRASTASAAPGQSDFDKQAQQGNSKINTTHQGYQQDR